MTSLLNVSPTQSPHSALMSSSSSANSSPRDVRLSEAEIESILKQHLFLDQTSEEVTKQQLWSAVCTYCAYTLERSEYEIISEYAQYLLVCLFCICVRVRVCICICICICIHIRICDK
jgi:hypothetical protein